MPAAISEATGTARARAAALAALVAVVAATIGIGTELAAAAGLEAGAPAPALVARSFGGDAIDLAQLRGRVVLLNFWASWCTPCREEMPALDAMAREHAAEGLVVLGLSADDPHDRADALKIARQYNYQLGMLDDAAKNGFGAPAALPLSYVIAADGRIAAVIRPRREGVVPALRAAVTAALIDAGRPLPP